MQRPPAENSSSPGAGLQKTERVAAEKERQKTKSSAEWYIGNEKLAAGAVRQQNENSPGETTEASRNRTSAE
jgi:hypothetical protein